MHSMSQYLLQAQVAFSITLKYSLYHKGAWTLLRFILNISLTNCQSMILARKNR